MSLTKLVNGKRRPLTPSEEAAVLAEWDAATDPPPPVATATNDTVATLAAKVAELEAKLSSFDQLGESE